MMSWWQISGLVVVVLAVLWLVLNIVDFISFMKSNQRLLLYFRNDLNRWYTYEEIMEFVKADPIHLGWQLYRGCKTGILKRRLDVHKSHVNTLNEEAASTSVPKEAVYAHHYEYKPVGPKLLALLAGDNIE